jgi:hydroxylysine kinase
MSPDAATAAEDVVALFAATLGGGAPPMHLNEAAHIARDRFGVEGDLSRLTGERDQNFQLAAADGRAFVLKVFHPAEDPQVLSLTAEALLHLERSSPELPCPRIVVDRQGQAATRWNSRDGASRAVRLLTWSPGRPAFGSTRSTAQRTAWAVLAARLGRALRTFHHPAAARPLIWDLRHFLHVRALLLDLRDLPGQAFMQDFFERYAAEAAPRIGALRRQVVHNDLNSKNVLISEADESQVVGVIDFGDVVETALVADVAVAASAQATDAALAEANLREFVEAYCALEPLDREELALLPWLAAARKLADTLIPAWCVRRNPSTRHYQAPSAANVEQRLELVAAIARTRFAPPV